MATLSELYVYDMAEVDRTAAEIATQLEASGDQTGVVEVKIDGEGFLSIGGTRFKNLSEPARLSRVEAIKVGLMGIVERVIKQGNTEAG